MYSLYPEDSVRPGSVSDLFQDTVQRFVPGFLLSRGRRGLTDCQMTEEGGDLVQQAMVAARRVLDLVLETERSGHVPGLEEISDLVTTNQQEGRVAGLVTEKLLRAARTYWNINKLT